MPTYEYHCTNCGKKLEVEQKISAQPLTDCPDCAQPALRRGPGGGIGLQFKGSGFYKTDYCQSKDSDSGSSGCCPCDKNK